MFFENVELNPDLHATMDVNVVADADIIVLSVPTIAIESVCLQIDPLLQKKRSLLSIRQKVFIQRQTNVFHK